MTSRPEPPPQKGKESVNSKLMNWLVEGRDMADLRELTQTLLELIEADALERYEEDLG